MKATARPLRKSVVLAHRRCELRAWYEWHGTVARSRSTDAEAAHAQEVAVAKAAQSLHPGGVAVPGPASLSDAAANTARMLAEGPPKAIFNAAFVTDSLGVRVDALVPVDGGIDVHIAHAAGSVKDAHIDDAAVAALGIERAGVAVQRIFVIHPDTGKALEQGQELASVLTHIDVTARVRARLPLAVDWVRDCAATLAEHSPAACTGTHCNDPHPCPFLGSCNPAPAPAEVDLIAYLPLTSKEINAAIKAGATRVSQLPAKAFTHERNRLVRDGIMADGLVVRPQAAQAIKALAYPLFFLDFESASPALPLFTGMRPYQPIEFQYSVHKKTAPGGQVEHFEFLDVTGDDPRRAFTENLIRTLGGTGAVLVFSAYERTRMRDLATLFPDLEPALTRIAARLFDLLPLVRRTMYHKDMRGKWSIKAIQPVLPRDSDSIAYASLGGVANGAAAQAAYFAILDPNTSPSERERLARELLVYCSIDTRELLRVCEVLEAT